MPLRPSCTVPADQLEDAAQARCSAASVSPSKDCRGSGAVGGYLLLPCLPLLCSSLPGLSRPPSPSLRALPCRLSGRSADSARWLPEDSLPLVRFPEPAVRDAGGWLFGGLAAGAAPPARPTSATALLVWPSSTARPRATPMSAPSSAPTTTRNWPRRRSDRSTGPPSSNTVVLLRTSSARWRTSSVSRRPNPGGQRPTSAMQPWS